MSLIALACAAWYFGVKRPDDIEAAALAKQRTANSFTIPGLNADMVWIAPGSFLMGAPEHNLGSLRFMVELIFGHLSQLFAPISN